MGFSDVIASPPPPGQLISDCGLCGPNGPIPAGNIRSPTIIFDGGGSALVAPLHRALYIPFACTVIAAVLLSDTAGNATVDIWKVPFASYNPPTTPTSANSITAGDTPALVGANSYLDTGLAGWITAISPGDTLMFALTASATIKWLTAQLVVST